MLYVIAENHAQAEDWKREHDKPEARYVHRQDQVMGIDGGEFVCVGTWYLFTDNFDLLEELGRRGTVRLPEDLHRSASSASR